jgi:hypothetical protein
MSLALKSKRSSPVARLREWSPVHTPNALPNSCAALLGKFSCIYTRANRNIACEHDAWLAPYADSTTALCGPELLSDSFVMGGQRRQNAANFLERAAIQELF